MLSKKKVYGSFLLENSVISGEFTGVGHYAKHLSATLDKISDSKQVTAGFMKSKSQRRALLPRKLTYKLLAYRIVMPMELLWGSRYDAAIFTNFNSFGRIYRKIKTAVVVHDLEFIENAQYLERKHIGIKALLLPAGSRFLKQTVPRSIKRSDYVITTSCTVRDKLVNKFDVDIDRIIVTGAPPSDKYREAPLDKHNLPADIKPKSYLLYQATIEPRKNHIKLLEAYESLPKRVREKYPLVLSGGFGWDYQEVVSRVNKLKAKGLCIHMLGYVTEEVKIALYQNAKIYLQPSLSEGFGMPILEAMACGAPTLVSDIPIFHEVCGDASIYFDPLNPDDISNRISLLIKDTSGYNRLVKLGMVRAAEARADMSGYYKIKERLGI